MLCVETIGKIRRRRLIQGESISSIARDLGLARNTVKRALKVEGDEYEYRRARQPMPKLGPFKALLDTLISHGPARAAPSHTPTADFAHIGRARPPTTTDHYVRRSYARRKPRVSRRIMRTRQRRILRSPQR